MNFWVGGAGMPDIMYAVRCYFFIPLVFILRRFWVKQLPKSRAFFSDYFKNINIYFLLRYITNYSDISETVGSIYARSRVVINSWNCHLGNMLNNFSTYSFFEFVGCRDILYARDECIWSVMKFILVFNIYASSSNNRVSRFYLLPP